MPEKVVVYWKCEFCGSSDTREIAWKGVESRDSVIKALGDLPMRWKWLDAKPWCHSCDPRK